MAVELLVLGVAVVVALGLAYRYPDTTERWYRRINRARSILLGVFAVLVAFVLIGSGSPTLMVWGGVLLVLIVLELVFEGPLEKLVE